MPFFGFLQGFLGESLIAQGDGGSRLYGCQFLLEPSHRELCLLSPVGLLHKGVGLLVKELIKGG
jgi:hypothetical protein